MKKILYILSAAAALILCAPHAFAQNTKDAGKQTLQEATDSLNALVEQAKAGDAVAQNEVGTWYYIGRHVEQNYKEAAQWWARSAKQGNPQAIGNLGMCYQTGNGVERDSLRAVQLYDRSLKTGENAALFNQCVQLAKDGSLFYNVYVANCYLKGIGVGKNATKAAEYFEVAANKGSLDAQRNLGVLYMNNKKYEQAYKWFQLGSKQGDPNCTYYCGMILMDGKGMAQDKESGFNYLLQAANDGLTAAEYQVGSAYYEGNGVVKNPEQGAQWLIKAANNGSSNAQFKLGMAYVTGNGVPVDYDQAASWLALCSPKSVNTLKQEFETNGSLYGTPFHTYLKGLKYYYEKDYPNALKMFKQVGKAGQKEGNAWEGVVLCNSGFDKRNPAKGIKQLQEAANKNNPLALYLMGVLYEAGKHVDKNQATALKMLEAAAEQGYSPALCYLGDMYFEGRGVPQDYEKAVTYYLQAKALLTPSASKRLATCYDNGWGGLEENKEKAEAITKTPVGSLSELLRIVPLN